ASALACLANPRGIFGMLYPLRAQFDPSWKIYRERNFEWMSTLDQTYAGSPMVIAFFFLLLVCVVLAATALPRRPWIELAILALLAYLGLSAVRFVPMASFGLL